MQGHGTQTGNGIHKEEFDRIKVNYSTVEDLKKIDKSVAYRYDYYSREIVQLCTEGYFEFYFNGRGMVTEIKYFPDELIAAICIAETEGLTLSTEGLI